MMKQIQKGFTLIELMIVVAIIGILAAIAIPQYSDYTSRTRAAAAMAELGGIKTAVSSCFQETNVVASCDTLAEVGITSTPLTKNITVAPVLAAFGGGLRITATSGATASTGGAQLTIIDSTVPAAGASVMTWTNTGTICTAATAAARGFKPGTGDCP